MSDFHNITTLSALSDVPHCDDNLKNLYALLRTGAYLPHWMVHVQMCVDPNELRNIICDLVESNVSHVRYHNIDSVLSFFCSCSVNDIFLPAWLIFSLCTMDISIRDAVTEKLNCRTVVIVEPVAHWDQVRSIEHLTCRPNPSYDETKETDWIGMLGEISLAPFSCSYANNFFKQTFRDIWDILYIAHDQSDYHILTNCAITHICGDDFYYTIDLLYTILRANTNKGRNGYDALQVTEYFSDMIEIISDHVEDVTRNYFTDPSDSEVKIETECGDNYFFLAGIMAPNGW